MREINANSKALNTNDTAAAAAHTGEELNAVASTHTHIAIKTKKIKIKCINK